MNKTIEERMKEAERDLWKGKCIEIKETFAKLKDLLKY